MVQGHTVLLAATELANLSALFCVVGSLKEYQKPGMQMITGEIGRGSKLVAIKILRDSW